jgi:hypothetical protein
MRTRLELDAALDDLERRLPDLIAEHPDSADFWPEFAGIADEITDSAGAVDFDQVHARIDAILRAHGLAPP